MDFGLEFAWSIVINKGILLKYLLTICFSSIFLMCINAQPSAKLGVLDLREVNFSGQTTVPLSGEWRVYPGEYYAQERIVDTAGLFFDPANGWYGERGGMFRKQQTGIATYDLTVVISEDAPNLSVKIPIINTAYKLLVNNEQVASVGKVGKFDETSEPYWEYFTRSVKLNPGRNNFRLIISNFDHHRAGMFQPIVLGEESHMNTIRNLRVGSVLFLTGCLLVAGVFALGLFWFKTSDVSGLLFFFFCIFYSFWVSTSSYVVIPSLLSDWTWISVIRLEYMTLAFSIIFYGYFINATLKENVKSWIFHLCTIISLLFISVTLFGEASLFTMVYPYFIAFMGIIYFLIIISALKLALFSHKLTWINLIGYTALCLVIVMRVLTSNGVIPEYKGLDVIGNITFIFSQAMFMAIMFGRKYRDTSLAALAASRTRDDFLNTMSHELKTPMNAILGMATFLEKSKLSNSQRDKLKAIKSNGESLMSLITDVLSISEVGTGKLKLKNTVLSIESCVDSALSLSKQHLNKEKVKFTSYIDPKLPKHVRGDSSRIKQVLMHVLNGAFKSTSKGVVELQVKLDSQDEDKVCVRFELSDTGNRNHDGSASSSFSLFKVGSLSGKSQKPAEGEMHMVKELVELMGGTLEISRVNTKGTKVVFTLALQTFDENTNRRTRSMFTGHEVDPTLKVLYAEDNPVNQKLIVLMLDALGLKVDIAKDGNEAVEMATKKYYNIILMDIQMPVMDGLEASRRIIQNSSARPIIIATTANLAEVDKRKCFEAGMNDFVSKPINQEELKLTIIKWQGLKKYLDDSDDSIVKLSS